jgi:hypothetical protein
MIMEQALERLIVSSAVPGPDQNTASRWLWRGPGWSLAADVAGDGA